MSDDTRAWATVLGLTPKRADRFRQLADKLEMKPADILRLMVERVIGFNRKLGGYGLPSPEKWLSTREIVDDLADDGLGGLSLHIRPTNFMWPSGKLFPWSAAACKAAVIGYEVNWPGDLDDFLNLLRGA
jgi:hypothetical protein